jgi:Zn-dependent M28 family amino/carboxypeptidase
MRNSPAAVATISEHAGAPLRRALEAREPLTAVLVPDLVVSPVTMHNVIGIVEGRDARHRSEMVVVGAHLDHDGTDADGRIYNGADDNASGTAAVIAAAGAFARAAANGDRPARAVLFALWTGEEKGSLGAEAFVGAPQPGRRVVANLNLDMVGRHEEVPDPADWRFHGLPRIDAASSANTLHVLGYSYSKDLTAELRAANTAVGLTLLEDYDESPLSLLQRSDNWPFLAHRIPALFLTTGLHPEYHTPDDDTARIDFDKLTRIARLATRAAWIMADGPEPRLVHK